ncbi:MAG: hypothetical protein ACLTXI_06630 [Collinsella sp.]
MIYLFNIRMMISALVWMSIGVAFPMRQHCPIRKKGAAAAIEPIFIAAIVVSAVGVGGLFVLYVRKGQEAFGDGERCYPRCAARGDVAE